jgi:hypothetical protein
MLEQILVDLSACVFQRLNSALQINSIPMVDSGHNRIELAR